MVLIVCSYSREEMQELVIEAKRDRQRAEDSLNRQQDLHKAELQLLLQQLAQVWCCLLGH